METAMRQHPVEARRQAEGGQRVHRSQESQIGPVDGALPEQCYCQKSTEKGNDHYHKDVLFRVGLFHKNPHERFQIEEIPVLWFWKGLG